MRSSIRKPPSSVVIADLEFYLVAIPCVGQEAPVRSLLVQLSTDTGLRGWGEARVPWRPSELAARRDLLLPILGGRSIFDIEELLALEALRPAPLRCAVEMASWDLVGRVTGQPLCHLFGGGYRRQIPLAVRLAAGIAPEVAQTARELAEQGFHAQIVTSCGQPEDDRETLAAVREIAQDRAELRFDAGAGFDMETARDFCTQVEDYGLQFVIDPLAAGSLDSIASLRRQVNVPLAVWRSIQSPSDMLSLVRCGAAPAAVVDLQLVGGMVPARKCAAIAQAAGLNASLGSGPSLGVALAAMLQLAAAAPAFSHCNECAHHQLQDDVLSEHLEIIDGMIAVPQGSGLGVDVDRAKVERYQIT
ncbi:MAG: mandelate racemase/muconate lactonizing enzyme family protein [Pirellulales bacterium]|nr:mandelate racemase/muconate lactonizing enzyme family protein [Pirellulales bacterium]